MKLSRKKLLILFVLLLLAGGAIYFFVIKDDGPPQVQEFSSADDVPAEEGANNEGSPDEEVPDDAPVKPELEKPAPAGTASVTLSFAEQQESNIVARAFAESDGSGSCELKLTKGDQQVVKTSGSNLQTSYYQCDGFEFSVNDMPSSGTWTAVVTFIDKSGARSDSNSMELVVTK